MQFAEVAAMEIVLLLGRVDGAGCIRGAPGFFHMLGS